MTNLTPLPSFINRTLIKISCFLLVLSYGLDVHHRHAGV